jgi:hypothetical protein
MLQENRVLLLSSEDVVRRLGLGMSDGLVCGG